MSRLQRFSIVLLLALLTLSAGCLLSSKVRWPFTADFEDQKEGAAIVWDLHSWSAWEGFPAVSSSEQKHSGSLSAKLIPRNTEPSEPSHHEGSYLLKYFEPQSDTVVFSMWVYLTQQKRALTIDMGSGQALGVGGGGVSLYFSDQTIQGYTTSWQDTGYQYPLNTWIQLQVVASIPDQAYTVSVRTDPEEEWQMLGEIGFRRQISQIQYVLIANYEPNLPRNTVFYVDDIFIGSTVE